MRSRGRAAALSAVIVALAVTSAFSLDRVRDGFFRLDFDRVDDLLTLPQDTDVRVLEIRSKEPKRISDAHIKLLREWVESGGVVWAVEDGLESTLVRNLARFRVERFNYRKTGTGKRGGELIVRGVSERLVIGDHALTEGVAQLYLFPRYKFDGTMGAAHLVEMTDTRGNHGLVIAAIRVGKGLLLLDGTAREKRLLFGRIGGFDEDRPNSVEHDGRWNSYDWPKLLDNAVRFASEARELPA